MMDLIQKAKTQKPIWLMRQAGRYLPEYREIREKQKDFINFCLNPKAAAEVTLQPITRFDFDAAIIFSDILMIPYALGQKVEFVKDHGPQLSDFSKNLLDTDVNRAIEKLTPVFEAIDKTRSKLDKSKNLIGFCGAPWTVATYMIEGKGSKDHSITKKFGLMESSKFQKLLDKLSDVSAEYLIKQMDAGADTLQIFDSWAGSVPFSMREQWIYQPIKKIVEQVRLKKPNAAIIGFPKGIGSGVLEFVEKTGVDAVGLDYTQDIKNIAESLNPNLVTQGNLDPTVLIAGGEILEREVERIKNTFAKRHHIFNLGHGILPETPIENVEKLLKLVRG